MRYLHLLPLVFVAVAPAMLLAQPAEMPPVAPRSEVQVVPLDINTTYDDFAAVPVLGERAVAFTSARPGTYSSSDQQSHWLSARTSTGWTSPVSAGQALAHAEEAGTAALTPDGNFMIFAAYEWQPTGNDQLGSGRTDLYSAERVGGGWTNVKNLGPVVNSSSWDSQPALSSDGRTLYFASDRPGGLGGVDVYVSYLSASGWTAPQNLGTPVNTMLDDMGPTIGPDGKHLFFSSNGHGGSGGFDIFVVSGGDRARGWTGLENLGTPINSASDEFFYASIPNSKNAYFSSNRNGNFDIYTAYPNPFPPEALVTVSGKVLEYGSRVPLGSSITVTDLSSGEVVANYRTDNQNGDYYVVLTRGRRYSITAESPDHIFYSDEYAVPPNTAGKDLTKDIELYPTAGGTTRLLVYFDHDKSDLKNESKPDLNRAIEFLKDNPAVKVEIGGHTDSTGSDAYNVNLSQARAESVRRYLIQAGIDGSRLLARGYGEAKPVDDNGTEAGRALNRRVEMKVSK